MPEQAVIAGLSCSDVLAKLSEYTDGELSAEDRAHVDEHLRGCDWCTRFGGEFALVVTGLREALGAEAPPDEGVKARLGRRLDALFEG